MRNILNRGGGRISPFRRYLFPTIVSGARSISDLRGLARVTKRETVDPLGVGPSGTLLELDKVSSAILGREQLGITDVNVTNLGGLDVLDAQAGPVTVVVVEANLLVGAVVDVHVVVSLSEGRGGQESQKSERLVHFLGTIFC